MYPNPVDNWYLYVVTYYKILLLLFHLHSFAVLTTPNEGRSPHLNKAGVTRLVRASGRGPEPNSTERPGQAAGAREACVSPPP